MITASQLIFPTVTAENQNDDFVDLCAMHFRTCDYGIANLATEFFGVRDEDAWPRGTIDALLVLGFPSAMQKVDYDELKRIEATQIYFIGRHTGPGGQSGDAHPSL
jgi:hypothetical protein